jgi:hypothetical protein
MQKEVLAMKRKYWLLMLVFVVLLNGSQVLADGDFYVVAVGGGVGTKIASLPYPIYTAGFYYLGGNLSSSSGNGITVNTDNVTIDLMGFCLSGTNSGYGIYMGGRKNVEIRNGVVSGWNIGICEGNGPDDSHGHRVLNIRAADNGYGIALAGRDNLIKGCTVLNSAQHGIHLNNIGTISNNVVNNCSLGILAYGGSVIGNTITCNSGQTGIDLSSDTSTYIMVDQNTINGTGTHKSGGGSATVYGTNAGF